MSHPYSILMFKVQHTMEYHYIAIILISFSSILGILDTGMTVSKLKVISSSEYARRRDEIFYRITKRQLSELYGEYEADE
jgi:hypothetical protein